MKVVLEHLFRSAIQAVDASTCILPWLPPPPTGRTVVVGAGKAAASMARAVERHWEGDLSGIIITRYGHVPPPDEGRTSHIEYVEAGHPVPDEVGVRATRRLLEKVRGLTDNDLVICLISGGGSALMTLPPPGISLEDKQLVTRQLLRSGCTIAEMNCVRKHLSEVKGGRLALACWPARVVSLLVSDIPGDDPSLIASGPTLPDNTDFEDARSVLKRYHIDLPPAVARHLEMAVHESPKRDDPRLSRSSWHIVARPSMALEAAAEAARQAGLTPLVLGDNIQGEAREVAADHAEVVRSILHHSDPIPPPCVLLSGGEMTVTVKGQGRGGRSTEFLLALAHALRGETDFWALCADTDGLDGTEANAGAFVTPDLLARAEALGVDPRQALEQNDSWSLFNITGELFFTGPTFTNVNDFRAIIIQPRR